MRKRIMIPGLFVFVLGAWQLAEPKTNTLACDCEDCGGEGAGGCNPVEEKLQCVPSNPPWTQCQTGPCEAGHDCQPD